MNTLTETERQQMIEAVQGALHHAYTYGRMVAVVLDGDQITVDVQPTYATDCIVAFDRVSDVLGPAWDEGLQLPEQRRAGPVWVRDTTDEVDAALHDGATWWVDEFGADALAEARREDDEPWNE
jgi:hypothetical protein